MMQRIRSNAPAFVVGALVLAAIAGAQVPTTTIKAKEGEGSDRPVHAVKERSPVDVSQGVPLIPRAVLFGNPERTQGRISPDGTQISFIAPSNGVLNVWVGPASDITKAKPITSDTKRGITQHSWAHDGKHILYLRDKGGDENWRVYSVPAAGGEVKDLTPLDNVAARIVQASENFPEEIVIAINDRNPAFHDLYRVNIKTGERTLLVKNEIKDNPEAGYASFEVDDDYKVRFATIPTPDGGLAIFKPDAQGAMQPYDSVGLEDVDSTAFVDFDKTGKVVYIIDSRGRDTAGLYAMDIETKKKTTILEDDRTDISGVLINPITKKVEAVQTNYDREHWAIADQTIQVDFYTLRTSKLGGKGDMNVTSRSKDDRFWIVTFMEDDAPARTVLLDRGDLKEPGRKPTVSALFVNRPALEGLPLVPMHSVVIKARDGLEMVSYLSLPLAADADRDGKPEKPVPMVLNVHGGPWARDTWGFDAESQWLANRGYAVLNVNFRGSTGFGKKHLNAGNREWGGKMHDDLIDAVNWAVEKGITTKERVAIYGGSYGGYAALAGLTFTPDVFACGVSIVGPSNINTLIASIPAYWKPFLDNFAARVGDFRTPEGQKFLNERSPLNHVAKIKKPLLIGQGANDPRVKQAESDQIVKAMSERKIPVTYVLYPDEGHGFARPTNRLSFYAVAEHFFQQHLGYDGAGRTEPIGDAFKGSSINVPAGAEGVPGLSEALSTHEAEVKK